MAVEPSLIAGYSCAVFDCDGVILDSNPIKIEAFRVALADEDPTLVEQLIAEHRATGGVSRYAKLDRFYRKIRPLQPGEDPAGLARTAAQRFAKSARLGLQTCPEVVGAREALQGFADRRVTVHVISGGDQDEVRATLEARGLAELVTGIHGSPTTKEAHLDRLFDEGELFPGGVYFGDAELDMVLAEDFGLEFVFVAGVSDWAEGRTVAAGRGHRIIEDFGG